MLPFSVVFRPGVPPYEEIVFGVKKAIAAGRLEAGSGFPSVRAMSRELNLNPNTCQKAVTVLVNEGRLEVRPGVGTVIREPEFASDEERLALIADAVEALVVEGRQLGLSEAELKRAVSRCWKNLKSP